MSERCRHKILEPSHTEMQLKRVTYKHRGDRDIYIETVHPMTPTSPLPVSVLCPQRFAATNVLPWGRLRDPRACSAGWLSFPSGSRRNRLSTVPKPCVPFRHNSNKKESTVRRENVWPSSRWKHLATNRCAIVNSKHLSRRVCPEVSGLQSACSDSSERRRGTDAAGEHSEWPPQAATQELQKCFCGRERCATSCLFVFNWYQKPAEVSHEEEGTVFTGRMCPRHC